MYSVVRMTFDDSIFPHHTPGKSRQVTNQIPDEALGTFVFGNWFLE